MFGLKLVWDWRDAWKWASIQVAAVSGALQLAIVSFPDTMRQYLPDWLTHWVAIFCFAAIAVARVTATKEQPDVLHKPD
jgi:hypothetical protein